MPSAIPPSNGALAPGDHDETVQQFLHNLPEEDLYRNNNAQITRDLDEEVRITRKRKPTQKLDEDLLLSEVGLPKLRRIARSRVRFNGKGHEFTDISRLLNTYQLWLDELFPKAKFTDALAIVEGLGHKKRMQVSRRAWIDASKPSRIQEDEERIGEAGIDATGIFDASGKVIDAELPGEAHEQHSAASQQQTADAGEQPLAPTVSYAEVLGGDMPSDRRSQRGRPGTTLEDEEPAEDELDALLAEQEVATSRRSLRNSNGRIEGPFGEESDEDDELDILLASAAAGSSKLKTDAGQHPLKDFEDEEEVLAGMGW